MTFADATRAESQSWSKVAPVTALFTVLTIIVIPIMAHMYLPLVDLPNHIARFHLAREIPEALSGYYDYSFKLVPNSAVDLLWLLVGESLDTVRFTQLSIAFASVGLVAGTMLLSRQLWGVWSAWPAAIGLCAYHASFLWGFQNYLVALPFVLLSTALWLSSEGKKTWQRLVMFAPIVFALYVMHFFAFIGFAVIVFGREVQLVLEARRTWKTQFAHSALLSLPFLACIALLLASVLGGDPSPAGSMTIWGHWMFRLEAFGSLVFAPEQFLPRGLRVSATLTLTLLCIFLLYFVRRQGVRLQMHSQMRGPAIALLALVFLAPIWLNGVAFVHIRFPIILAAVFFAATRWRGLSPSSSVGLAVIIVALIAVRAVQFNGYAAVHDREVRQFLDVVSEVPEGARVLPVRVDENNQYVRLWHVAAYAVNDGNVYVPTLFQGVHGLKVRDEWKEHSSPSMHAASVDWLEKVEDPDHFLYRYVADWSEKYTHLVMIDPDRASLQGFDELHEIRRAARYTLYEIQSP
ncbi:MAG: hypothetical protein AAFN59_01835 [Pseudomonadota bacterium]